MGIHEIDNELNKKDIQIKDSGIFYHFINFFEKNRPELMYEFIM